MFSNLPKVAQQTGGSEKYFSELWPTATPPSCSPKQTMHKATVQSSLQDSFFITDLGLVRKHWQCGWCPAARPDLSGLLLPPVRWLEPLLL